MAKYDNPIRGYVRCPVCASGATVHQVGEGQLIATGEPPKNSRNVGLKYYRCPECGNSSISKKVNEFIESHQVSDSTELLPLEASQSAVLEGELLTENQPKPETEVTGDDSVTTETAQASQDNVSSGEVTEEKDGSEAGKTPGFLTLKRVLIAFGLMLCIGWMVRQLMPKKKHQEEEKGGDHVTA